MELLLTPPYSGTYSPPATDRVAAPVFSSHACPSPCSSIRGCPLLEVHQCKSHLLPAFNGWRVAGTCECALDACKSSKNHEARRAVWGRRRRGALTQGLCLGHMSVNGTGQRGELCLQVVKGGSLFLGRQIGRALWLHNAGFRTIHGYGRHAGNPTLALTLRLEDPKSSM